MTLRSCVAVLLSLAAAPDAVSAQMLLSSGSNVRLRAAPDTDAAIAAMLPLGTELQRADSC